MAYTFNQKNWVAGEVITANGVNRIEECLGHLVDEKQNILYFDAVPTAGSPNLVDSNGIYNALKALNISAIDRRPISNSTNAVQSRGIYEALLGKQDLLIFDSTPKSSSSNPVTSQGIYQALNLKQNNLTFDSTPISDSNNPVTSKGIYQALSLKQDILTFDNVPDSGSNNPVTSNGIYRALRLKQNNLTFDSTPILNSSNPVTSEGIYISLQNLLGEVNNSLDDLNNSFYQELITKQNKLTFDNIPKNNSNNPVTSKGIYNALQEIELKIPNTQIQSDWKEENTESKAYIKNRPIIHSSKQLLLENIYSNQYSNINNIRFWIFFIDDSTLIPLIVGNKYKIQINDNIYEEYFSQTNSKYYFVGTLNPNLNENKILEKDFGILFEKISEDFFKIKRIYFKERNIQKFSITINELLLIGRQYLDMPDWSKELTKPNYSYNELTDLPIIPTKTSQLTNDSGFLTVHQDISGKADKNATVSNVTYDTTNKKITKTINGTTSNVVSAATLKTDMSLSNVENKSSATIRSEITSSNVITALGFTPLKASLKGANNGVAELDSNGRIPSSQLPSYVDDVLEYSSKTIFPSVGETGKIYVDTNTNLTYRWSGSSYVAISSSITLGTTSSTAFRGDYGNTAYTHAINKGSAFNSGLYKITTNSEGHVITATKVVKSDITALGIPENNIQSDWEDDDVESEAYIKNKPEWLYSTLDITEIEYPNSSIKYIGRSFGYGGGGKGFYVYNSSVNSPIHLIVGELYKIQINNNFYYEYFQFSNNEYYFVGTQTENIQNLFNKDFGIVFTKIEGNNLFILKELYYLSSYGLQQINILSIYHHLERVPLINKQYLDIPDWSKEPTKPTYTASEVGAIPITEKGISGGVATLDENGIVPSSQLPVYVDTILEYNNLSNFPSIGEAGKIYVALDTNKSYRWSGSQYTEISSSISLGEVQGTAYEGHKGKANALAINNLQNNKANKSTTISGYGIIDAKIENGIITLGNNTIQPIVDNNYNHTDNNFTNEEKNKLAQINTEAEKNIQSDWNITDINSDAYIKNKPNITDTITENNNNLVTSGAIYTELIKKQNNLINVLEISEIRSTDYIYIERNKTIYKILASKLGKFTPGESDPNALETNDGNIITDENGNEIIIDNNSGSDPNAVETNNGNVILDENGNEIIINTNTTDTVVTNDGKIILTEDQRELNLG